MKYVMKDKRWHFVTRLSVLLIIAPYMAYVGYEHRDRVLLVLAVLVFLFDLWSLTSKQDRFHQEGRLLAALVQAPYMGWAAYQYNDPVLGLLAAGTFVADTYTFCKGFRAR